MEFSIQVDLAPLMDGIHERVFGSVLPQLRQAVWAVAQQAQIDWLKAIQGAKLWEGEKRNYAATIDIKETGPYSALVWSDYQHAQAIEEGRPAYDQKKWLQTSSKTRLNKAGKRYLIIPFQHNVSTMPKALYAAAKQLTASRVTGMTTRISATGAVVPKRIYLWGGRLGSDAIPKMQRHHVGMVRFDLSTAKSPRSSYLTFRTMSESSSGWIIPPQPGQHLVKQVVDNLKPLAEKAFRQAMLEAAA